MKKNKFFFIFSASFPISKTNSLNLDQSLAMDQPKSAITMYFSYFSVTKDLLFFKKGLLKNRTINIKRSVLKIISHRGVLLFLDTS